MKKRKLWKSKAHELTAELNTLNGMMYAANGDFNIKQLEDDINHLKIVISTATKDIEEADFNRGLLSERILKLCPQEIPKYAGTPSEDFTDFRNEFNMAMESNIISKADQTPRSPHRERCTTDSLRLEDPN